MNSGFPVISVMWSSWILRWEGLIPRNWSFSLREGCSLCPVKNLELPIETWRKTSNFGTWWASSVPKLISWEAHICAVHPVAMTWRNHACAVHKPSRLKHSLWCLWPSRTWFSRQGTPLSPSSVGHGHGTAGLGASNSFVPFSIPTTPQFETHTAFCKVPNCKINSHY